MFTPKSVWRYYDMDYDSDERFNKDWIGMWNKMIENDGYLDLPDSYDYVPTLRCNMNCKGCYQKHNRKIHELTLDEFKDIFGSLDIRNRIVKLIGGEIFVRKEMPDMLDFLTDRKAYIIIGTNAWNLPPIERFKEWNIVEMTTSIDGIEKEHDTMRGREGSFKRVKDFIWNMGKYGLGYKILTTTMVYENNINKIDDIKKIKDVFGIDRMRFQIPKWSSKDEIDSTVDKLGKDTILDVSQLPYNFKESDINSIKFIQDKKNNYFIQPNYFNEYPHETINKEIRKNHKVMCRYLFRAKINPDGSVNPCFYIMNNMGNLLEESFEEVWNNEKYRKFRMDMVKNNLMPICENCCSMEIIDGK